MTKWRLAAIGAGVSLLAGLGTPASAAATSGVITDPDGHGGMKPSGVTVAGNTVAPLDDGSNESSDILSAELETVLVGGQERLRATIVVDGTVPADGSTNFADFDAPDQTFVGGSYKVLFHNKDKMHNGDNTLTGCQRLDGSRVRDQGGHWEDGYYSYVGLAVTWDGTAWQHTPEIGEYDPSPDGAFFFTDIEGEPNMNGRFSASVTASAGNTTVVVEVTGEVHTGDQLCVGGVYKEDYAAANRPGPYSNPGYVGDRIANVFGLTTVDQIVVLPVAIPLSIVPGESDIQAIGGFISYADCTNRKSPPNPANQEVCKLGALPISPDTLGDGASCPTPTFGGTLPNNPLWAANQNQGCQVDDDALGANAPLPEFRPSNYDFVASF